MDVSSVKQHAQELERQGKVREALAMYRHVLTSLEDTPELLRELPLYVKAGDLFLKLDNPRAAVSLYETAGKIYAAHGSAKSVNKICAKVVRVMPERSHVYTRLLRIMLQHGHIVAARLVLASYAKHAGLAETSERLELLADRTDEHVRPVLEMLIEMAERLERPVATTAAAEPPKLEEIAVPLEEEPPEPSPPPPPIDGRIGYGVPEEEEEHEEEVAEQAADAGRSADALGLRLLRADAVPIVEEPEAPEESGVEEEGEVEEEAEAEEEGEVEEESETERERGADEDVVPVAEHRPDAPVTEDESEPAEAVTDDETVGGPFGLGLVTSDLASDDLPPPGDNPVVSGVRPPVEEPPSSVAEEAEEPPPYPLFDSTGESGERDEHLDAPEGLTAGAAPPAEPEIRPSPEPATRQRVRGDGTDWYADPGLPGRAARRRSPVGSVLLAASKRERRRRARYILAAAAALLVIIIAGVVWGDALVGGGERGMIVDSGPAYAVLGRSVKPAAQGVPQSGQQAGQAPLTLRPDPALAVESRALPPLDDSLSAGGAEQRPRIGMPPSEGGVTVVAVTGLPIEHVSGVTVDGRRGHEAQQVLETGERLQVLSLPAAEPADTAGQGEVRIAPGAGGVLTARLRVGMHDVELRGNVSEAVMRALVLRLAETSTSPS